MVRTVLADRTVDSRAFIKINAEKIQRSYNGFHRAFYIPLVVGILNTKVKDAAALVGEAFVYKRAVKISKMNKAGRAWPQPCYFCAFRQAARRINGFIILGGFGNSRK